MTEKKEYEIITNLSGILIPISLASISLVNQGAQIIGIVKNILTFTIMAQVALLIISLWLGISLFQKEKEKETKWKGCKVCFFIALILIAVNHIIVLLSS
jgi:hypothetical protein